MLYSEIHLFANYLINTKRNIIQNRDLKINLILSIIQILVLNLSFKHIQ